MKADEPAFVFEVPPASGEIGGAGVPGIGFLSPQAPASRPVDDPYDAARRDGALGRATSMAERMSTLRAWEFAHIPMLRRRAPAEVFFAVWALSGRDHDAAFTAKEVLAKSRISERAARLALRMLLDDGWIQRYGNGHGNGHGNGASDIDGRLRPYLGTAKLKAVLVEYEARIAETF